MADDRYSFNLDSIKRIVRTVIRDEARITNIVPPAKSSIVPTGWQPFTNNYAGTIPAYGIVAITNAPTLISGVQAIQYTADQPGTTFARLYAVNGPLDVPQGADGMCLFDGICQVLYDSGSPAVVGH